ncbi:MAG: hypothetical protein BGO40_04890 [Chryseobacterium sp. 39-10]|mgnify:CR=1 FL=1|nr:MAG: hypothetical protein BGO40_04890 [Chryseobacterium sp. 39-10]
MKKLLFFAFIFFVGLLQAQQKSKSNLKTKKNIEKEWVNPVKLTKEERNRPYMDEVLKTRDSLTPKEAERRRKNIAIGNPFAKQGFYPKIATLSKGKYLEFHDRDSIVSIGSVRYNRKQKKIIGFIEEDLSNPDRQPLGDTHGRWISPDPLSEEYSDWTPYRYGFNNPLRYTDPTGMLEDDYGLDQNGNVTLIQKTNDEFDRLYVAKSDSNGNAVLDSNGNAQKQISGEGVEGTDYAKVNKANSESGSIISSLATNFGLAEKRFPNGINFGRTTNANDAANVFMFAAKNSNVEWGLDAFKVGGGVSYTVYTGHEGGFTPSNFSYQSMSKLLFSVHSHKNVNMPSPNVEFQGGDYNSSREKDIEYYKRTGNTTYPKHYMYYAPNDGKSSLWLYHYRNQDNSYYKRNLGTGTINPKKMK